MASYLDELTGWVKKNGKVSRRDKNVVLFLAIKKDLIEAMAAGYSLRTIWRHMSETQRIEVSYDSFLSYVSRYIRTDAQASEATPKSKAQSSASSQPAGFKFNPVGNK